MYDMSGLLGKLAVKGAVGADEKQVTDGSYYDVNGNLVPSTSGGYAYQKLTVDPSKVYELNILFTGGNVSTLVLFDENDNVIHNSPRVAVSGNFVFTGITSKEVYSDSGKFIHRLGTESYFKRSTLLPGDTAGNFEEVDEIPEETGTNYNEEVNSMIRQRYSLSEELAILRQRDSKPDEFEAYNEYAEYCKVEVKRRMIEEGPSPGDGDGRPNT